MNRFAITVLPSMPFPPSTTIPYHITTVTLCVFLTLLVCFPILRTYRNDAPSNILPVGKTLDVPYCKHILPLDTFYLRLPHNDRSVSASL